MRARRRTLASSVTSTDAKRAAEPELGGERRARSFVDIGHDDARAVRHQHARRRRTKAGRAAGDEQNAIGELQ